MNTAWAHWRDTPEAFAAACRFVSVRVWGYEKDFGKGTALGVFDGAAFVAAVIYTNFDAQAGVIEMSGASDSPRWLQKPVLHEMFAYPFKELGCQAVVMRADPGNKRLARILTAYGFSRHDIPRMRGRDTAEAIFVLGDDDWRANGFHKEY